MKKIILLVIVLAIGFMSFAQDPQIHIKLRTKTLVQKEQSMDSVTSLVFTSHDLRRGKLRFKYRNASADSGLNRSFMIENSAGQELFRSDGSGFKIKASKLKKMLRSSALKVYTMAIPSDPAKAAIVRVRRIEIAELSLMGN